MKKLAFYPLLFALNPILLVFSANVSDLPLAILFPGVVIIPLVCGLLFALTASVTKNVHRSAYVAFLAEIWFFHYGTVHLMAQPSLSRWVDINAHWLLIPVWSLIFLFLGSSLVWKKVTSPQTITAFLNVLALSLVIFSTGRIILDVIPRYTNRPIASAVSLAFDQPGKPPTRPDIYLIILDGYARQDVLTALYHFDNQPFINELEKRGFQIPSNSKSNYMQTALSLASSLNLDYLNDISANMPDRGQLIGRISHSQVRAVLEGFGYQMIALSSGYQPTEIIDADRYYAPENAQRSYDFEALLAVNSLVKPLFESGLIDLPINKFETQQERILFSFETLSTLPAYTNPKFVFTHLLTPHPPFIFDGNGPITPDSFYILADGERLGSNPEDYQQGYREQVQFTNRMLLAAIDEILKNSPEPPIIIIQADHGSGMLLHTAQSEATCHFERFGIFSAFYLPGQPEQAIPADITPVNIFRLIFNLYFDADFQMLPDKQYYSSWARPYQFIDVTELSDIPCAMP